MPRARGGVAARRGGAPFLFLRAEVDFHFFLFFCAPRWSALFVRAEVELPFFARRGGIPFLSFFLRAEVDFHFFIFFHAEVELLGRSVLKIHAAVIALLVALSARRVGDAEHAGAGREQGVRRARVTLFPEITEPLLRNLRTRSYVFHLQIVATRIDVGQGGRRSVHPVLL